MATKIYTKTGDKGSTSLIGGTRVLKHNEQLEAYGTIDELNAHIGLIHSQIKDNVCKQFLEKVQHDLFIIGSCLAVDFDKTLSFKLPELSQHSVLSMENEIDRMNTFLNPLKNFILPTGNIAIASVHIARCVCRRAERNCVFLLTNNKNIPDNILQYLNRLSDYLFVLARYFAQQNNIKETIWIP